MSKKQAQEWEVEKILQRGATANHGIYYLVKWKGFPLEHSSWEPITNLENCQELITEFEQQIRETNQEGKRKRKTARKTQMAGVSSHSVIGHERQGTEAIFKRKVVSPEKQQILSEATSSQPEPILPSLSKIGQSKLATSDVHDFEANLAQHQSHPNIQEPEAELNNKKRAFSEESHLELMQNSASTKKLKQDVKYEVLPDQPLEKDEERSINYQNHNTSAQKIEALETVKHQPEQQQVVHFIKNEEQQQPLMMTPSDQPATPKKSKDTAQQNILKLLAVSEDSLDYVASAKPAEPQKAAQIKFPKLSGRELKRYEFCDKEYELYQKNVLINLLKKMEKKPLVKSSINMIDLTNKRTLLDELDSIKRIEEESTIESVDLLAKIEYGWMAIGRNSNQYIMLDVNLIDEERWRLLVQLIAERKSKK